MSDFIRYDPATGEVVEWGTMSDDGLAHLAATEGFSYVEGKGTADDTYIRLSDLTPRPRVQIPGSGVYEIAADGVENVRITGLPNPHTLTIDGEPQTVNGTILDMTTTVPGTYELRIEAWPRIPATIKVIANAP